MAVSGYTPEGLPIWRCEDKQEEETLPAGAVAVYPLHIFRALLLGPPNSGKTSTIFTLLYAKRKSFERIVILRPFHSTEYEKLHNKKIFPNFEVIDEFIVGDPETPKMEEYFDEDYHPRTCLIIDDVDVKKMIPDSLFSWISSHCNCSIIVSTQNFFKVSPFMRECSTHIFYWPIRSKEAKSLIANKMGFPCEALQKIEEALDVKEGSKDFIEFDFSGKGAKIRKNILIPLLVPKEYNWTSKDAPPPLTGEELDKEA